MDSLRIPNGFLKDSCAIQSAAGQLAASGSLSQWRLAEWLAGSVQQRNTFYEKSEKLEKSKNINVKTQYFQDFHRFCIIQTFFKKSEKSEKY